MEGQMPSNRRLGYLVWGLAALVIAVPEITAAFSSRRAFTTISEMVGHLEYLWAPTALIVIALIVFALLSIIRVRPPDAGSAPPGTPGGPPSTRTPGGRLTRPGAPPAVAPTTFDAQTPSRWFVVAALLACVVIVLATLAAIEWWDDDRHFQPAYVLYGLLGLFWLVVPSIIAIVAGKDAPFPTLFRTVHNIEDRLRQWAWAPWSVPVGPALAWLVSYVVIAGLTVLLLHIVLYPFPDISHIINPTG
jgi:hypothetical protein